MGSTLWKNQLTEENYPCIWMQAGVVLRRFCTNDFYCTGCRFDRAMRRVARENRTLREKGLMPVGKRSKIVFWQDKLKELPPWQRPCLHHMKGRIDFKACTHEYKCANCEFDQYFHDQFSVHAVVKPVDVLDVEGFKIPQGYYIHRGHSWVKIEEGYEVRVGVDDFALRLLGPLDRIEAPLMGKEVKQDQADILMNRGAFDARLLSPVSGVVTAVNSNLREQGSLANQDPYSHGWVLRIHANNLRHDLKNLMMGNETQAFYAKELDRLYQAIEEEAGPLTVDGGQLGDDIFGSIPQAGWKRLTKLFLRT